MPIQNDKQSPLTPLEKAVGIKVAEETYDELSISEQVIVDLLVDQWTHKQIGFVFGLAQPTITAWIRRIRTRLAISTLRLTLDVRATYKNRET